MWDTFRIEYHIYEDPNPPQRNRQGPHLYKCIFLNADYRVLNQISLSMLRLVSKSPVDIASTLVQVMVWCRTDEPARWLRMTWCKPAHGDVIKWKHFPRHWPFVRGIHRWPVNSPHKGQWRGALMFSLICAWINDWVNNGLRRQRPHYDGGGWGCEVSCCGHHRPRERPPRGQLWVEQCLTSLKYWPV